MKRTVQCLLILLGLVVLMGQGPCEELGKLSRRRVRSLTVEEMLGQFLNEDPDVRRVMVLKLGETVRDKDATVRARVAANFLTLLKGDPQPLVRGAILSQLPEVMGNAALPALRHAFIDPSPIVRRDAVAAIRRVPDPGNPEFLINLIRLDPDCEVRVGAIIALADYPDYPETVGVLRDATLSRDDSVAIRARTILMGKCCVAGCGDRTIDHMPRQGSGPGEDTPETEEEPGFWGKYFGWLPRF